MASNDFKCNVNENILVIDDKVDTSNMKKYLTGTSIKKKINNINYEIYNIDDKFKMGDFYEKHLKNKQNFNIMDCEEFDKPELPTTNAQPKAQTKAKKGGAKKTTKIGRGKFKKNK